MDFEAARARMVDEQLVRRGIADARVLRAFREVPRERFVPAELAAEAYRDTPLPIGSEQTISQPYIVALTCEALLLRGHERVLEVGTGSGYAAAIMARLAPAVFSVERLPELAALASTRLEEQGYGNVSVLCGDGTLGWQEHAPYDAIAVAAGGPAAPQALLAQLAVGGRLVIPIGPSENTQVLMRITREGLTEYRDEDLSDVRFVPLIGAQGWGERLPQP